MQRASINWPRMDEPGGTTSCAPTSPAEKRKSGLPLSIHPAVDNGVVCGKSQLDGAPQSAGNGPWPAR